MAKTNVAAKNSGKSAKPGTQEPKAAKEKVERVAYTIPEGGLESVPEDFSRKLHKPLKKADFKEEHVYLNMRADELELKVKALREDAKLSKELGSTADRAKAKRLRAMQTRMAELKKELSSQGIDVDALLAAED